MMLPDDTQPRSPFQAPSLIEPTAEAETGGRGPGCLVWGLVSVVIFGLALAIIVLAGLAGWASGQRTAQGNATATQNATINEQIGRIPGDISSGNMVLLQARVEYLATLTPGVPGVEAYAQTATAIFLTRQPSVTPPPASTATPAPATLPPTVPAQPTVTGEAPGLDLPGLLEQAQAAAAVRDWDEAIALLDVLLAADPGFETATVRTLMSQALNEKALQLLRYGDLGDLAEGILIADRAEQFGPIGDLSYERYIASLYLDALNTIGTNFPAAIQALSAIYSQVPGYRDVRQLLFGQYVAFGDAWATQSEFCPAAVQYQNALGIQSSPEVSAKRDNANTICAQATPPLPPGVTVTPGGPAPIAPIGVPGT